MLNVILIGMPGSGKSTVGVLLAKALLMDFVDTDLLLQKRYNKTLIEIIESLGIEGFKRIENETLKSLKFENTVVATGGSAVYGEEAMTSLKSNAVVVYLKLTPKEVKNRIINITTRGIVMQPGCTIDELYLERAPLYEKYADFVVDCEGKTVEETVGAVVSVLNLMFGKQKRKA